MCLSYPAPFYTQPFPWCFSVMLWHHQLYETGALWSLNFINFKVFNQITLFSLQSTHPEMLCYSDAKLTKTKGVLTKIQWKDDAETSRTLKSWEQNIWLWVGESLHYEGTPEVKRMFVCGEASLSHAQDLGLMYQVKNTRHLLNTKIF